MILCAADEGFSERIPLPEGLVTIAPEDSNPARGCFFTKQQVTFVARLRATNSEQNTKPSYETINTVYGLLEQGLSQSLKQVCAGCLNDEHEKTSSGLYCAKCTNTLSSSLSEHLLKTALNSTKDYANRLNDESPQADNMKNITGWICLIAKKRWAQYAVKFKTSGFELEQEQTGKIRSHLAGANLIIDNQLRQEIFRQPIDEQEDSAEIALNALTKLRQIHENIHNIEVVVIHAALLKSLTEPETSAESEAHSGQRRRLCGCVVS